MRVVGYRSQARHALFSTLGLVRGWTVPTLYGERLALGVAFGSDTRSPVPAQAPRGDAVVAVHPLAADRDRFYHFSGGDTVTVMRYTGTIVHIVRVRVEPRLRDSTRLAALDGELDLDAEHGEIVRMRGRFVVLGRRTRRKPLLARLPGLVAVAYAEFVNKRVDESYWLPASQRTELQSTFAALGGNRAILRIVSTFGDFVVTARDDSAREGPPRSIRRTTWARRDSVAGFNDWQQGLGDATAGVSAGDFDDFAPDVWKATGPPRLDLTPTRLGNVLRFDRVEGLYVGMEANLRRRSAVPGLTAGAFGGWATAEGTARGAARATLRRDRWSVGGYAGRELASTNDFERPNEPRSGGLDAALGSRDDFDYVDRRRALASVTRVLGSLRTGLITLQVGAGDDRAARARLTRGWLGSAAFRPNRVVKEGGYTLGTLEVELHPNVAGGGVQPGVGATVRDERAAGGLRWQRVEASAVARRYRGRTLASLEGRAGMLLGETSAPQALFELGGRRTLPGYEYKEFVGDRGALFRSDVGYTFPLFANPVRLGRYLVLPGLAPGVVAGVQGGWTALSSDAARATAELLCGPLAGGTVCRPTGSVRASAGFGLTLLSGMATLGVSRPIDRPGPWKLVGGVGRVF